MRRHPRELPQALGLLGDGRGIERDERLDSLLQQHADGRMKTRDDGDALGGRRRQQEANGLVFNEPREDTAQQLVLAEHLVQRRALLMTQRPQLAGFLHHLRVGGDRLGGRGPDVVADVDDQRRNVIEQAVARKHFVGADRQQIVEPREPSRRKQGR